MRWIGAVVLVDGIGGVRIGHLAEFGSLLRHAAATGRVPSESSIRRGLALGLTMNLGLFGRVHET